MIYENILLKQTTKYQTHVERFILLFIDLFEYTNTYYAQKKYTILKLKSQFLETINYVFQIVFETTYFITNCFLINVKLTVSFLIC